MTKELAIDSIDKFYTAGFISQETFSSKVARINQIAEDRSIHFRSKNGKYLAVVTMAKNGL